MQAGVCKADGLLGATVVVALMLVAVAIYLLLMRKHAPPDRFVEIVGGFA